MQGFDRESGLAPALEPSAQRVNILVTVGVQEESHPGARRLSRLRAVEDHLAVFPDPLMWIVQRFGRNPARARNSVRSRLDVQRRPQIHDHQVIAGFQPPLELDRRHTSFLEMTEEVMPSHVLENDVRNEPPAEYEDQGRSASERPCCNETDDVRAEIAKRDPGSGP